MIQVTQKSNNKQLVAVCVAWADGSTVEPDGKMENHMKSEIKLKTSVQNDIDGVIYVCVCRYSSPCSLSLHLTMVDMLGIRGVCSCRYKVSDVKICTTIIQLVALHIFISKSECDFFFFCESKPSTVISITSYLFWLRTFRWPRHWFVMYRKVQQNAIFALNKTFLFVSNPRVYNSAEISSNGCWCHHHERQRKKMDGGDEDFLYLTFKSLITRDCSHTVWILFCVSGTRIWFLVVLDVFVCSGGQSSRCKWHSQGFSHHQQKFIKLFICSRWDCPPISHEAGSA